MHIHNLLLNYKFEVVLICNDRVIYLNTPNFTIGWWISSLKWFWHIIFQLTTTKHIFGWSVWRKYGFVGGKYQIDTTYPTNIVIHVRLVICTLLICCWILSLRWFWHEIFQLTTTRHLSLADQSTIPTLLILVST